MKAKTAVRVEHGREKRQVKQMRQIAKDGVDPFDWKILPKYHKPPVLRRGKFWLVTENEFPYKGTAVHLLLIYRKRVRFPSETAPAAWTELQRHLAWIEKQHSLKSASLVMRFGDPDHTGASVDHLHLHVIAGGKRTRGAEKIKTTVGYHAKKKGGARN
jgi:diadenosine tetraphosphate (Ap4A) HIT family hydrolase